MIEAQSANCRLPFHSVNRPGSPAYDSGLQRHHLLPRQLLSLRSLSSLFDALGYGRIGFDDFRSNGLLLPADDRSALRMAMPLHRGPHYRYNGMVIERVGQIEACWARRRLGDGLEAACAQALMQLRFVQRALRRRLLQGGGRPFTLNRRDPVHSAPNFSELDAMADQLWPALQSLPESAAFAS